MQGGWVRKLICGVFIFCVPLNVFVNYGHDVEEMNVRTLRIMYKVAYAGYLVWGLSCSYIMWARINDVVAIFNEFVAFNRNCSSIGYQWPGRSRLMPNDATLAWILSGVTILISTLDNIQGHWSILDENMNLQKLGVETLEALKLLPEKSSTFTGSETAGVPLVILYIVGSIYLVSNTWRGLIFTHLDLLLTCWAIQFRRLMLTVNENLAVKIGEKQKSSASERKVQGIILYLKFSDILERFNKTQGILILTGIVSEIFYVSTCSAIFVTENRKSGTFHVISVLASFIPFFLALTTSAEVNQVVRNFVNILKRSSTQELECSSSITITQSEALLEAQKISDAVANIHHDLEMNSVGFQGLGFFTLTYGFLGSIVTAIATYSLIILQLSEKVNSKKISNGNCTVLDELVNADEMN